MSTRPSLNRRAKGSSRSGARGNEIGSRHRGPVARNQNTSYGEDSTTDRRNGSNPSSESKHEISPESRTENQRKNRSNTEYDGPKDPGNRKRKLNEAIAGAISSGSRFKKPNSGTSSESDVYTLYSRARGIPRVPGPSLNVRSTFINGSRLASRLETRSEAPSESAAISDEDQASLDAYRKLLAFIPGLEEQTKWTLAVDPSGIHQLASFLHRAGKKGRSDDTGSLCLAGIRYIRPLKDIPGVEEVPRINTSDSKETRGFNHHASARLLCPRHLRDKFDADRKAFCRDVQNGKRIIDHDDWPSFLYPETGYNPEAIDEGLLRGPFVVSCYRHLFTGARTAMKATDGKAPGQRCIAEIFHMTEVKPETIAYVAVLGRYLLNSKGSWCLQDGNFHSGIFKNIVDLFDDDDWAKETSEWWNTSVFGDKNNEEDDTPPKKKKKRPIVCRTFSFTTCRPPTSSRRTILPYPGNENGVTDHDEQHYGGLSNHIRVTDFAV